MMAEAKHANVVDQVGPTGPDCSVSTMSPTVWRPVGRWPGSSSSSGEMRSVRIGGRPCQAVRPRVLHHRSRARALRPWGPMRPSCRCSRACRAPGRCLGGRWRACCPAHDDGTPSLDWRLGDDRRVLLTCRAGCTAEVVVGALGARMADFFPPSSIARACGRPPQTIRRRPTMKIRDAAGGADRHPSAPRARRREQAIHLAPVRRPTRSRRGRRGRAAPGRLRTGRRRGHGRR